MTQPTPPAERNSYPSILELEARHCPELRPGVWEAAKVRIADWGRRMGARIVHIVDSRTMLRLESIEIAPEQERAKDDPITREYRGWTIAPFEGVQLGYRIGEGAKSRPGKGRKLKGYLLTYAPDNQEKFVSTLEEARGYVDSYMGPEEK